VRRLLSCNKFRPLASGPNTALEAMHEKRYPLISNPRDPRFQTLRSLQTRKAEPAQDCTFSKEFGTLLKQ
jgi:hypothetical protein